MQSHSDLSDDSSLISSSTNAPSDETVDSSTTLVPGSLPDNSKQKSSEFKAKKNQRKDKEPKLPTTLRPPMFFA